MTRIIGDPNDASWLDFLSTHPAPSGAPASPPLPPGDRDMVPWQRDRPPAVNGTIMLEPASRSPSLAPSPKMQSNKRSRAEAEMDDGAGQERQDNEIEPSASRRQITNTLIYGKSRGHESEDEVDSR